MAGLTSDNASNMKVAVSKQQFCTLPQGHYQSFAHTLQLAIGDALEADQVTATCASARRLVGHFNRSQLPAEALEAYQ